VNPLQVWIEEEKLHEGAEAIVTSGFWFGRPAVKKFRRARTWRHPELDSRLTKSRLTGEVRALLKLQQLDFPCPSIYHLNLSNSTMFMERIEGIPLVMNLNSNDSLENTEKLFTQLGNMLRKLHLCGITHGDLTTTNIILNSIGNIFLIDYGLSQSTFEVESYGLDLHVLYECLQATHPNYPDAMQQLVDSYLRYDDFNSMEKFEGGTIPTASEVISRFDQIKGRVRYHD
jgi:Kae1-associated kinase Bud32